MHRLAPPRTGEHALGVEPLAEPGHVQRLVLVPYGVERLVPGGEYLAGAGVEVGAGVLVPDRQVPAVVLDRLRWRATRPGDRWQR